MSEKKRERQEERAKDLESVRKIKRKGGRESEEDRLITQQEWRKEKNNVTNIKRTVVRGCAKETESERESEISRNNNKITAIRRVKGRYR